MAPYRKVVGLNKKFEEHESLNGRNYTWRRVTVTTLTLECGHTKIYRGDGVPSLRARCKADCEFFAKYVPEE